MKTIVKIVASLSLALLALACQQFVVDTQMTPEKAASMLRLDSDALDSYTIQGEKPQAVSFKVSSTTPWTITRSENAEWLKVSPASSSVSGLSADVVITASANDDTDAKAKITFTYNAAEGGKYTLWLGYDGLYGAKVVNLEVNGNTMAVQGTDKLEELNKRPFKNRPGSRKSAFLEEEQEYMRPLPVKPYEPALWSPDLLVGYDYLVSDGMNKYSLPFDLIGHKVNLRITRDTLQVSIKAPLIFSR